jgi:hypothetical protein
MRLPFWGGKSKKYFLDMPKVKMIDLIGLSSKGRYPLRQEGDKNA